MLAPRETESTSMTRQMIERDKLGVLTKIGQGGQGVVYRAPNAKTKFAASMVYKEYKPQTRADIDFTALAAMPALVEESLTYAEAERLISVAAWPCALVENAGSATGFVMPAIPDGFFIPLKTVKGVSDTAAEFQHLLNHSSVLAARGIDLDDAQRYALLREVASGLAFLHKHGVCIGDISPKNLLFALKPHESVYFIDCDAWRINGVSALPQMETPEWTVPAGEELATVYSDSYKLGLLALRLVAGHHDTKNLQHIPSTTPGLLRQIITDTLSKAPQQRPLPEAWNYVLGHAIEQAQHQKIAGLAPTPVSTAPLPPPTPVVRLATVNPPVDAPAATPTSPTTARCRPPGATTDPTGLLEPTGLLDEVMGRRRLGRRGSSLRWPSSPWRSSFTAIPRHRAHHLAHPKPAPPLSAGGPRRQPPRRPHPIRRPRHTSSCRQLAAVDKDFVNAQLADHWIPQLSSKHAIEPWTHDTVMKVKRMTAWRSCRSTSNCASSTTPSFCGPATGHQPISLPRVLGHCRAGVRQQLTAMCWHGAATTVVDSDHCYAQELDSGTTAHNWKSDVNEQ